MFRSRKKSSGKGRAEESRDRDNSGFLHQFSDTRDEPPLPPLPQRGEKCRPTAPRNIQYLKLTEGFNFVLTSDTSASHQPPSCSSETYETIWDSRRSGGIGFGKTGTAVLRGKAVVTRAAEETHATLPRARERSDDKEAVSLLHRSDASKTGSLTSLASSTLSSGAGPSDISDTSPPVPSARHGGTWGRSGSQGANNPPQITKPHPLPRRTLSLPVADRKDPAATPGALQHDVIREMPGLVDRADAGSGENEGASDKSDSSSSIRRKNITFAQWTGRRRERAFRVKERSLDKRNKDACVVNGRGVPVDTGEFHQAECSPLIDTDTLHTQDNDTETLLHYTHDEAAQSNLRYSSINNSNREAECVPTVLSVGLQTAASDYDQETNKAEENYRPTLTVSSDHYQEQNPRGSPIAIECTTGTDLKRDNTQTADNRSHVRQCSAHPRNVSSPFSGLPPKPTPRECHEEKVGLISTSDTDQPLSVCRHSVSGGGVDRPTVENKENETTECSANMFGRSNKRSLRSKQEMPQSMAVYRKLDDTIGNNAEDNQTSEPDGSIAHPNVEVSETHPGVEEVSLGMVHLEVEEALSLPSEPATNQLHTDQTTNTDQSPDGTDQAQFTSPKPRKRKTGHEYENWTINQAVTRIADNISDDDEMDCDNISPGSSLGTRCAQGSRDSGLCVDVQASGVSSGCGDAEVTPSTPRIEQVGEDAFLETPIALPRHGNTFYENVEYSVASDETSTEYDNMSVLSENVISLSSESGDSPDQQRRVTTELICHDNHMYGSADHYEEKLVSSTPQEQRDVQVEPAIQRENMLKMRHLLVTGVLDTERSYLGILELLLQYKRTLEASCGTSQPVISEEDILSIFSNLQQLQVIHKEFVEGLQMKVREWSPEQTVGEVFSGLMEKFSLFGLYAENYQTAASTIHKCSQENPMFQDLAQQIVLISTTREETSLEDALFKPVQRLQRNTLVLHDLIKHTPKDHPDYHTLQDILHLSQRNLENFGTNLVPRNKIEQKADLVKSSFLVESVGASRKLRFIFVFSDLLVCTKREQLQRGKFTLNCKWFIPMDELKLDTKFTYEDDIKFSKKDEIDELKKRLRHVKTELTKELKKEETKITRPISNLVPSRNVEKLQKKAKELEADLILASPRLPFKVWHEAGKVHTLLMTTDYEREEWRELLTSLQSREKAGVRTTPSPSAFDVQGMVNSVRELPKVNEIGSVLIDAEEETMYGTLSITVHKLTGLTEPCDTYCCLEMDSYGHFFMKARTHISSCSSEPSWNEDFELELEGSQTLRVLCYRKEADHKGDTLLGRAAMEMNKSWLQEKFQEKTVIMNEYSLVLTIHYTDTERALRRTPARQSGTAVFGVQVGTCAQREGKTVPTLITACVQEVEKRGMDETGIYRVSGVTSDVQKLKKHFDKSVKLGVSHLADVDIHSVTGLLKLYLRELPDPVFTEASYPNYMDALKLSDKEGKEKCMLSLFHNLPDFNYYTAVYLLEHLLRISRNEADNKMGIHNLSTIFGPTLLAPATKTTGLSIAEMMSRGAEDCMKQSEVIYVYLNLLHQGASLRRSSAQTS